MQLLSSLLFVAFLLLLVFPAVSSFTALDSVNDASADVFSVPVVAGFHALACISSVMGVPAQLKSLLWLVLLTVADISCC